MGMVYINVHTQIKTRGCMRERKDFNDAVNMFHFIITKLHCNQVVHYITLPRLRPFSVHITILIFKLAKNIEIVLNKMYG